jgi:C-terminal processing protease CtpA/Prc
MPARPAALALLASVVLAACPGRDGGEIARVTSAVPVACDPSSAKRSVLAAARDWYLYPELLPADGDPVADPAAYGSASELLDALTAGARAQRKDRYWSYVASLSQTRAFNDSGASAGFGIQLLRPDPDAPRIFLADVYEGTPAFEAGFARGDELLAIGEDAGALVAVSTLVGPGATAGALSQALGPNQPGVTRTFEVRTAAGATATRTVAKREYTLRPVPPHRILALPGGPAGYVALRTFIGPADGQLREAFAAFEAAGVTRVVVDLRYNGGGLVSTARTLASLAGDGLGGQPMFRFALNPAHVADESTETFQAEAAAIPATRIAFITSGGSASASELVPNVLEPYREVALVGARTYGKPVGQIPFDLETCDLVLYLISFQLQNAEGEGGYYDGLPDAEGRFAGPLCPAADDLAHPLGDPAEASTAAALHWLETGACPPPALAPLRASPLRAAPGAASFPEPEEPSHVQRWLPGSY